MYHLPKSRTHKHLLPAIKAEYYPPQSILHMYEEVPSLEEIDINEFEDIAVERYLLLKIIENANRKGLKFSTKIWHDFIKENVKSLGLSTYFYYMNLPGGKTAMESKQNDHIAHYLLRLAYCKNLELRKRFIELEIEVFQMKYYYLTPKQKTQSCLKYCSNFKPLTTLEKMMIGEEVINCTPNIDICNIDFYAIPFYQVRNSVIQRQVYMHKGLVYLPAFRLNECLQYLYGKRLDIDVSKMNNNLYVFEKDERLTNILYNLEGLCIKRQNRFTVICNKNYKLYLTDVNTYSRNNYPLCMYILHKNLSTKHHLKHGARIQYGLFLKDAGFDCEQVLTIFQEHFCKEMTIQNFMKKYSYTIKYMYGLTGRKMKQTAFNCAKIIQKDVMLKEEHGCPFKHWDCGNLKRILLEKRFKLPDIEDIITLKEGGHCQKACTMCFDYTHKESYSKIVEHPNEYFRESIKKGGRLENLKFHIHELEDAETESE